MVSAAYYLIIIDVTFLGKGHFRNQSQLLLKTIVFLKAGQNNF